MVLCPELRNLIEKGSVESTHEVPTSHYHTKHCHAAVVSLGGLSDFNTPVRIFSRIPFQPYYIYQPHANSRTRHTTSSSSSRETTTYQPGL